MPILLVLLVATFFLGVQQQKNKYTADKVALERSYSSSIDTMRSELNKTTNDYESACYNYQALYTAYDTLYKKAGVGSGLQQLARVDGAKGNEDSCYR